jgi:hypothetical protein
VRRFKQPNSSEEPSRVISNLSPSLAVMAVVGMINPNYHSIAQSRANGNEMGLPAARYRAAPSAASRAALQSAATSACVVGSAPIETRTIQRPSRIAGVT